jgi:hypothetical protein
MSEAILTEEEILTVMLIIGPMYDRQTLEASHAMTQYDPVLPPPPPS